MARIPSYTKVGGLQELYTRPPLTLFGRSSPAESLETLLDFLRDDWPDAHIFRGQTKDFSRLLPSDYRKYDLGPGHLRHVHRIDVAAYSAVADDLNTARRFGREFFRGINVVMLNVPLGNILSQQYGLTSRTLDFTRSLDVAAFFSTHEWPHYRVRVTASDCGVIYRLKQPKVEISNALMERMHQRVGARMTDYDQWLWFDEFIPSWNHSGAERVFADRGLSFAPKPVRLSSPAICLTDRYLIANLREQLGHERLNAMEYLLNVLKGLTESEFNEFGSRIAHLSWGGFESRLQAQQACLMLAPSWHEALVPFPYYAIQTDNPRVRLANPPLAVGCTWLGIEDLAQFPEIETFYFHSATGKYRASLTPEILWPNNGDKIYELYRWLFGLAMTKGVMDRRVTFDDESTGIFDRGYY